VTTELSPKRVALPREAVPGVSRVGLLFNPANASKPFDADRTRMAAQGMGLKIQTQEVLEPADIERAFSAFVLSGRAPDVSLTSPEPFPTRDPIGLTAERPPASELTRHRPLARLLLPCRLVRTARNRRAGLRVKAR